MTDDSSRLERESVPEKRRHTFLLTLEHLDGRSVAVKRVREFERAITADLGGDEALTTAQRALIRRTAVLSAILEDREARWAAGEGLDLESYHAGVNVIRRCLLALGLERKARDAPSLHDYLGRQGNGTAGNGKAAADE